MRMGPLEKYFAIGETGPFRLGQHACMARRTEATCPYPDGTAREAWLAGYRSKATLYAYMGSMGPGGDLDNWRDWLINPFTLALALAAGVGFLAWLSR